MTLIHWNSDLNTGILAIDREHRHLIDLINRFHDHLTRGGKPDLVVALYEEFERHTEQHFASEEALMDAHAYAGAEAHKAEHRWILDTIQRHGDNYVYGRSGVQPILINVQEWLVSHILGADRQLGEALTGG